MTGSIQFCCDWLRRMATMQCPEHPDRTECVDTAIHFYDEAREWGVPIHDGSASYYLIGFCPGCGSPLPHEMPVPNVYRE